VIDRVLRTTLVATLAGASALLAYGATAVQQAAPPIPDRVVVAAGPVLYTRFDVLAGKDVFQRTHLMDLGSLYGNGSYFGPDWGTDHLDRLASGMRDRYARLVHQLSYASLSPADHAAIDLRVTQELRGSQLPVPP
jgi:nitric oxide reductase subunit B